MVAPVDGINHWIVQPCMVVMSVTTYLNQVHLSGNKFYACYYFFVSFSNL